MKLRISAKIVIGFCLIILCSLVSFWIYSRLSEEVNRNTSYVTNSEAVIRNSAKIHRTILLMQNSYRGYLLTENNTFLEPYYDGLKETGLLFEEERNLLQDAPEQLKLLDSIEAIQKQWVKYSYQVIEARFKKIDPTVVSNEYDELFEQKVRRGVGKEMGDKISLLFKEFERREYSVRQMRRENLKKSIDMAGNVTLILSIITITIGVLSAVYITLQITGRIHTMVNLAENISKGNFVIIVDKEKDELTKLSTSLNIMSEKLHKSFLELDQFAYVVSHDLKAPLRGMHNIIHWIEEDYAHQLSDELQQYMQKLRGRIERMENLITGLLDYTKIGRTSAAMEMVDTDALVRDIAETEIPDGVQVEIQNQLPVVHTDRIRLQQVFSNLISNAVKYQGTDPGKICISSKSFEDKYVFTVSDNGVGIAPEYHKKIFGLFQTLREKHETESTGIGLSIVKKIIEDKKGTITVDSDAGKGASFTFTWPKQ